MGAECVMKQATIIKLISGSLRDFNDTQAAIKCFYVR